MPEALEYTCEPTKCCTYCHIDKPISEFYTNGRNRKGSMSVCIPCYTARYRAKHAANPEPERTRGRSKSFKYHLAKYDLTVEQYEAMFAAQGGVCAICGEECKTRYRLAVDHNHETGENRGLLCQGCNFGIGHFSESVDRMQSAIQYIEKYNSPQVDDICLAACSG
jgi:hypothetical protein